jgi:hypothetical protein
MDEPGDIRRGVALAILLGVAPAFQNGLFILQLPLLVAVGLRWLHGERLPNRSARAFAVALVLTTLLALVPSQPFREFYFSYYLFSWFHLYVACATGVLVWLLSAISPTRRGYIIVFAVALALLLPVLGQAHVSGRYFSSNVENEYRIGEVASPLEMIRAQGPVKVLRSYSGLLLLAPVIIVGCCWYLLRRNTDRVVAYLCVATLFGLVLLLDKYRFNNFGSFALVLAPLVAVESLVRRKPQHGRTISLAAGSVLLAAFYLPLTHGLFNKQIPSGDYNYPLTSAIFSDIRAACAHEPGVVLADNTDGHFIRFHSECSVIADNFMLTEQHIQKLHEMESLLRMSPEELLHASNAPRYVYARYTSMVVMDAGGRTTLASAAHAAAADRPLVRALLTGKPEDLGPHFRLLKELRFEGEDGYPYARFFEVVK